MVNPEIRKLQFLNDLITQTLDVLSQRTPFVGGLSHTPYNDVSALYGIPNNSYPIPNYVGNVPFTNPQVTGTISHSPYQYGIGNVPFTQTPYQYGANNVPFINPTLGGISHTPMGWQNPQFVNPFLGGISHTPMGWQNPQFVNPQFLGGISHTPMGYQPWQNPQFINPQLFGGISHSPMGLQGWQSQFSHPLQSIYGGLNPLHRQFGNMGMPIW